MSNGGRNKFGKEWAERNLSHYKDLDSFVFSLQQPDIAEAILGWMHFRLQHEYICDAEGNLLVDFVGRYETLDTACKAVSESLELPLPRLRLIALERDNREAYYTETTRPIIHSL